MLKTVQLILFLLLLPLLVGAQNFNGKIINSNNGLPIHNAIIVNLKSNDTVFSNDSGFFKINRTGEYKITKTGYLNEIISIDISKFTVVKLITNSSQLDEVIINSNHLPKSLKKATSSIDIISQSQIQRFNNTDFSPILNNTPGVFMQSGALNTNRITIRGIGSRNLFGTSKIRAYFKNIPLTNGSGETTIEDFELGSISKMEIIKGATSSSYGAGLGGTIILHPKNSKNNNTQVSNEFSMGSFGLIKNISTLNLNLKNSSINTVFSTTNYDGYRDNNNYNRQTFTITGNHFINSNNDISILASFVNLKAFIPSSLNETDFINNPEQAAFTWQQARGFEDAIRGIIGLSWNHNYSDNLKQSTSIFTSFRDAYEPRPFNILSENSFAFGVRSRLIGNLMVFQKNMKFTIGGELFRDRYNSETFENLYEDFPEETGSVKGDKLSNFEENRTYYNLFFESDFELSNLTTLTFGLNLNKTAYKLKDRFEASESNPDQSGDFKFEPIISPKLGVSHLISNNISLFSSISQGFSPISLNETLLPDGQINTNLKPETGWNFEIGSRGSFSKGKLQYTISIYRLNIKNLVVSRRTAQDAFIGINAGKTRHDGLELKLNYQALKTKIVRLNPFINYTLNKFKFKEFIDVDSNFSGNDLTGVPSQVLNLGADYHFNFGLYGNIFHQYVGEIPITDSNTLYSDSYNLTHLKIGYRTNPNKKFGINIFLGINNLFNKHYASQILINASGFGGTPPRYYYPGNPINYYSGVRLNYVF
ncbi:TonB-dependent receptor [Winogradskyella echinorum]|uniref:TonB-dependent receptor n=1 Tax=Winogradskyella echinorum TaxID=538189 RepID=A0ABR6Y2I8_9FLAO|nr:TonB-dependent receptor [Winogradskyella echinorum]MBC3846889.1 TonB-dependent receptor [Winogradskyella echinorum]MBC5751237.1 TonB-dependent receptor [Winogradskyella echinorum]